MNEAVALALPDEIAVLGADSLEGLALSELEALAYQYADQAGSNEVAMLEVLAHIRDHELWRHPDDPTYTFRDYLTDFVMEAPHHLRVLPYSISYYQKRLSEHRRLVSWAGADPRLVLGASMNVVETFMDTIGARWDRGTGELAEITPSARQALSEQYGEGPLSEVVKQAVEELLTAPLAPGAMIGLIKDRYGPPSQEAENYQWLVLVRPDYSVTTRVKLTRLDTTTGEVIEEPWYDLSQTCPYSVIQTYARKLGATLGEGEMGGG